jgi:two-component system, NtrC family, response regulator AtoC
MARRATFDGNASPICSFPARILVIEDALTTREMLSRFLVSRGYDVVVVGADAAVHRLESDAPDMVILNLVGTDGLELLDACRDADPQTPILVVSDTERSPPSGRAATSLIVRPFEEREVEEALTRALGPRVRPGTPVVRRAAVAQGAIASLLGESRSMVEVRRLIDRVAPSDVTVLIRGESGTGKEVTARALRQRSRRSDRAFVKVNCAALPADLLESELFGYERGAFTGALQAKPGKFELADHGTMFLDEIGEMSPLLQAKLLQVLQDGEFARLGSAADARVDVRVIAATNRDLKRAVADGQFREDLYFRLNVVNITLPPLRDHKEDIPLLADHFLEQQAEQLRSSPGLRLSGAMKRLFLEYDWPGNVRELENILKRIIVLGTEEPIFDELADACASQRAGTAETESPRPAAAPDPGSARPVTSLKDISRMAAREAERAAILGMLERTRWNRKETAEILGISYKALLYKIKDNHLDETP